MDLVVISANVRRQGQLLLRAIERLLTAGPHKVAEEGVRMVGAGSKLRVKLGGDEPRMIA